MSVEIPQSMDDVVMQVAQRKLHGEQVTEDEVIHGAVRDILQALFDEALEGHYDDVKWSGERLLVTDFMGKKVGEVSPQGASFVADFRENADALILRLEEETTKLVGGR
ncbi:hypothetical protein [Limosilactobacillus antri]|uniref:Uncharacterized protein n=1 Tax=Limosilactobacillus antri DSM 16041 TaxID=525309 RepID=C8P5F8_9LACO|nr:hypothetical protein [Limosilactobacillus antri]EEW54369.1 hypothetical protein HMPREF0494_0552 [Limosilactobacillus antri DSM 16041]KRK58315.1 hypothetical protein FC31_GL000968 [Limosilactobacillus antri DSM 16041]